MKKIIFFTIIGVFLFAVGCSRNDDVEFNDYHPTIVDAIGDSAIAVNGTPDVEALRTKKHLFIYFSAHWCPPCRAFTPWLIKYYNDNYASSDFGLIFVSSDENQASMNRYMKSTDMPWIGLKLNSEAANLLQKKYSGDGIPRLVLLNGRDKVIADSYGSFGKYLGPDEAIKVYEKLKAEP